MSDERTQEPTKAAQSRNPASRFGSPEALLRDSTLTKAQKIQFLRDWASDATEREVATDEGMRGSDNSQLRQILLALSSLGERVDLSDGGVRRSTS